MPNPSTKRQRQDRISVEISENLLSKRRGGGGEVGGGGREEEEKKEVLQWLILSCV